MTITTAPASTILPSLEFPYPGKQCAVVTMPQGDFFFSYRTIVAFRGTHAETGEYVRVRMANHWSRTTGRHFSDLGCKDFPTVTPEEFARAIGFTGDRGELTCRK